MNERTVNIGILGGGNWTRTVHLPNLRQIPSAHVVAISSNDMERRAKAKEAWGGPLCFYEDPLDLLEDPAVQAVIICTPNHTHEDLAVAALERDKHVYCEKPAALTTKGIRRIAEARRADTVFQVGLELRSSDVVQRMQELIREGRIGAPKLVSCLLMRDWGNSRGWRGNPALSGGMVLELGVHYLDLFNALAGALPVRVYATGGHALGGDLPDYLWCSIDYQNEARATLGLTVIAAARNEIRVHVVGDEARLEGEIISGQLTFWQRRHGEPEDLSPARPADYRFDGFPGSLEALRDWMHAIRTGEPPHADLEVARLATLVSAAAEQSLVTGMPIPV